jgi:hypothetical protein
MLKLLLRRSGTKDSKPAVTKPAAAGEIAQGELWLNNNHESPGLFARADDDSLIEFNPAKGVHVGETAPANPKQGQQWFRSSTGKLYVYYDDGAGAAQWVVANPQEAVDYTQVYKKTEADAKFVDVAGDTMTGGLNVAGDVKVGGTLPAKPHAALNADGSVTLIAGRAYLSYDAVTPETATQLIIATGPATGMAVVVRAAGASFSQGVQLQPTATAWIPAVSESRLKDFVADPDTSQCWNLVRDVQLKRYYYKDQTDKSGVSYMGPMADWLGAQDPELLIDTGRTDEHGPIHTYNQGLLDMKALAALSAALKRIEHLETRLAALEVKP